jgi:CheY-like chemotaxis protein
MSCKNLKLRRNLMNTQKQLLIIDDDPDFVAGIKSVLEKAEYSVDVAYNPKDGFQALQSKPYDLLLLDIMMGRGAEGVAIARKLRKDPKLRELPVLIITGIREQIAFLFPGQPVHPHFVELDELVEKPVEPKLLLEKVSTLLKMAEEKKSQKKG